MEHREPWWVHRDDVVAFHDRAIGAYGGRMGIRSEGLLEQALCRPRIVSHYEHTTDVARLAACYTASVVQIHPFRDANKRSGWASGCLFAVANGWQVRCDPAVAFETVVGYAAGRLDEAHLVDMFGRHLYHL